MSTAPLSNFNSGVTSLGPHAGRYFTTNGCGVRIRLISTYSSHRVRLHAARYSETVFISTHKTQHPRKNIAPQRD